MKVCSFCSKSFEPNKYATTRQKFCSTRCKSQTYYKKYYSHFTWKNERYCVYCSKKFIPPTSNSKYCSEAHRKYHWKKRNWEKVKKGQRAWFKKSRLFRPEYFRQFVRNRKAQIKASGGSLSLEEWETIKKEADYTCKMCLKKEPEIKLTIDHIIPLSKGGPHNKSNIQSLCHGCNSRKKDH